MLSLPAGGHTAAHTAKQGENAQEDNGREKFALSLYCVSRADMHGVTIIMIVIYGSREGKQSQ